MAVLTSCNSESDVSFQKNANEEWHQLCCRGVSLKTYFMQMPNGVVMRNDSSMVYIPGVRWDDKQEKFVQR